MFWVPSFVFACLSLCLHGYFKKTNKIILMSYPIMTVKINKAEKCFQSTCASRKTTKGKSSALKFMKVCQQAQILSQIHPRCSLELRLKCEDQHKI